VDQEEQLNLLSAAYFRLLDALHLPFVRHGGRDPYHLLFQDFLSRVNQVPSASILEIGSRDVTGVTRRKLFDPAADFVGLDIHAGRGVDIVADAHTLSQTLPADRFDAVFAISVFEHLLFPWKVVLEMNTIMRAGGLASISTHPTWPAHELPWDFWRYQPGAFRALFNHATGFEVLAVAEGLPCKAYSLVLDPPTRPLYRRTLNQGVAVMARKIGPARRDLLHWNIDISDVLTTQYPQP
jgi:SAM-dependent methyltransferase